MDKIVALTPDIAVTAALGADDFAAAAALGYRTIINHRPDGEEPGQLAAAEARRLANAHGLVYRHIPSTKLDLFSDGVVDPMQDALASVPRPILMHCKSGIRSAIVWAAATSRTQPVEGVVATLAAAGFDLAFIRDDLDAQSDRPHWRDAGDPPARRTATG